MMIWHEYAAFGVAGDPKGQPRPRRRGPGGTKRMYDPGTAEGWKTQIAIAARSCLPPKPLTGPINLQMHFDMPRPMRLCRRRDPDGPVAHTAKPDIDNLLKAVMDCLTKQRMWADDSQVCDVAVTKQYHEKGGEPGAYITICRGEER